MQVTESVPLLHSSCICISNIPRSMHVTMAVKSPAVKMAKILMCLTALHVLYEQERVSAWLCLACKLKAAWWRLAREFLYDCFSTARKEELWCCVPANSVMCPSNGSSTSLQCPSGWAANVRSTRIIGLPKASRFDTQ